MATASTDLLIIGAGFSGLISALLAKQSGLRCIIVEQRPCNTEYHSHAHYLNAYSLEILTSVGLSIDTLKQHAIETCIANRMVVCHQLNASIGCIDLATSPGYQQRFRRAGAYGAHLNIPGVVLYRLLKALALQQGIALYWEHTIYTYEADKQYAVVQNQLTHHRFEVFAKFLLACDGAHSATCAQVGLRSTQKRRLMRFLSVVCEGSIRPYVEDEAMLYWIYHEALVACMVNFDSEKKQVLQIPIMPGFSDLSWTAEKVKQAFSQVCAVPEHALSFSFTCFPAWTLQAGWTQACDSKQWVYVLGDALHRVLPSGGLGLNAALADAHNLIWKLCGFLSAGRSRAFLSAYHKERSPEAHRVVEQSIENYHAFIDIADKMTASSQLLRDFARSMGASSVSVQSVWLQLTRYRHALWLRDLQQEMQPMLALAQQHFDGIAMHNATCYRSEMVFNSSPCQLYALDILPYRITVGMRLQNFTVKVDNLCRPIFTMLCYQRWSIFLYRRVDTVQQLINGLAIAHQVYTISPDKPVEDSDCLPLPLLDTQFLIVRPDAFVFSCVDYRDKQLMQALVNHMQYLSLLG